jgi:hypothetical protein
MTTPASRAAQWTTSGSAVCRDATVVCCRIEARGAVRPTRTSAVEATGCRQREPRERHEQMPAPARKGGLAAADPRDPVFATSASRDVVVILMPPLIGLTSLLFSVRGYARPGGGGSIRRRAFQSYEGGGRRHRRARAALGFATSGEATGSPTRLFVAELHCSTRAAARPAGRSVPRALCAKRASPGQEAHFSFRINCTLDFAARRPQY